MSPDLLCILINCPMHFSFPKSTVNKEMTVYNYNTIEAELLAYKRNQF